jgi:hypothetical protein
LFSFDRGRGAGGSGCAGDFLRPDRRYRCQQRHWGNCDQSKQTGALPSFAFTHAANSLTIDQEASCYRLMQPAKRRFIFFRFAAVQDGRLTGRLMIVGWFEARWIWRA